MPVESMDDALRTAHLSDRLDTHSIDEDYLNELLEQADEWWWSGDEKVTMVRKDGVKWRIVASNNTPDDVSHEWKVLTVYPKQVDRDEAMECDLWDETDVLNLHFYSLGN